MTRRPVIHQYDKIMFIGASIASDIDNISSSLFSNCEARLASSDTTIYQIKNNDDRSERKKQYVSAAFSDVDDIASIQKLIRRASRVYFYIKGGDALSQSDLELKMVDVRKTVSAYSRYLPCFGRHPEMSIVVDLKDEGSCSAACLSLSSVRNIKNIRDVIVLSNEKGSNAGCENACLRRSDFDRSVVFSSRAMRRVPALLELDGEDPVDRLHKMLLSMQREDEYVVGAEELYEAFCKSHQSKGVCREKAFLTLDAMDKLSLVRFFEKTGDILTEYENYDLYVSIFFDVIASCKSNHSGVEAQYGLVKVPVRLLYESAYRKNIKFSESKRVLDAILNEMAEARIVSLRDDFFLVPNRLVSYYGRHVDGDEIYAVSRRGGVANISSALVVSKLNSTGDRLSKTIFTNTHAKWTEFARLGKTMFGISYGELNTTAVVRLNKEVNNAVSLVIYFRIGDRISDVEIKALNDGRKMRLNRNVVNVEKMYTDVKKTFWLFRGLSSLADDVKSAASLANVEIVSCDIHEIRDKIYDVNKNIYGELAGRLRDMVAKSVVARSLSVDIKRPG